MFRRVLVANRGEIAIRVMRTLREMRIASVAVYSDADRDAAHVRAADRAVRIGPPPAAESYLSIPAILSAARESGAEAVHPGYGFLAENPAFVRACEKAGLAFLGPTVEAMAAMGDKSTARGHADRAGVPTVPGVPASADSAEIALAARRLPLPVLLKAAAGGGGKGMRRVTRWDGLADAIEAAKREGLSAFGDPRLIVEAYIHPVRHVEVQVLGDGRGDVLALGERECSLQRRHQKIIEESPSPAVDEPLRERLLEAACKVAAAVRYRGAGTVEFLLGQDGRFYFLEMNTRLQVEHPVTELITGLDLVELQLRVADEGRLPLPQSAVRRRGCAIEVRLYAENADEQFLPTSGEVLELHWPHWPHVRVDSGIARGQVVGVHYDPLLAKIIAWGDTRERARARLVAALEESAVLGLVTNQAFLIQLLESDAFRSGDTFTHTVEEWAPTRSRQELEPAALVAAALGFQTARTGVRAQGGEILSGRSDPFNPWRTANRWRV